MRAVVMSDPPPTRSVTGLHVLLCLTQIRQQSLTWSLNEHTPYQRPQFLPVSLPYNYLFFFNPEALRKKKLA